jgi:hypothetical protein
VTATDARTTPNPTVEPTYEVVWPRSALGVQSHRLAPRLDTLEGRRVGFVWDYLFRGDELFPVLERELTSRYPGLSVVGYDTFGNVHGPDEAAVVAALGERLAAHRVDAVVVGMGC